MQAEWIFDLESDRQSEQLSEKSANTNLNRIASRLNSNNTTPNSHTHGLQLLIEFVADLLGRGQLWTNNYLALMSTTTRRRWVLSPLLKTAVIFFCILLNLFMILVVIGITFPNAAVSKVWVQSLVVLCIVGCTIEMIFFETASIFVVHVMIPSSFACRISDCRVVLHNVCTANHFFFLLQNFHFPFSFFFSLE